MRTSPWPMLLCGWVLAAVFGPTAYAFEPADELSDFDPSAYAAGDESMEGPYFQPVQYTGSGSGGVPQYGGPDPYFAQGGYPPNAWPGVSPYAEPNFREMYNYNGVWQHDDNDECRRYLFSAEFLIAWGLRPGYQLIGAPGPPSTQYFFPGDVNIFPHQTWGTFANIQHYGTRLRYGWENPDESMFILSGFYVAQSHATAPPLGSLRIPLGTGLLTIASIPYNNGIDGTLATFDTNWYQRYSQEFWGADADVYVSPFFRRPSFKIAFTYGVKYLRVSEEANIRARDSSQLYTVAPPGVFTAITATGLPELDTQINSSTISDIVGPSMGLRYDLGGEKFKLWGQTKFALGVDMEQQHVWGRDALTFQDLVDGAQTPLYFNETNSHVHMVPIFDQSIYGEFPLFAMLPLINRLSIINKANFRIGFNYVAVWEMSRPASQIEYNIFSPSVQTNRTWFSLSTVSFAADWKF